MAQEIADSKLLDTWSSSGTKIEPDISKIIEGWQLGEQPPHEYMNWLQNTFGSKLNHILKNGVASWNNETEYLAGSSVQHNGNVWLCKVTNTNSEPTDSNNNWDKIPSLENLALTVDTINDFPASATTGDTCIVKDLDRGGTFIYDATQSAVNNGGTIFDGWVRQYSGAVNVKWFGAVGDGITDDTIAIQAALDTYKHVLVHAGIFMTTTPLYINSGQKIIGSGGNSQQTIILKTTTTLGSGSNVSRNSIVTDSYGVNAIFILKHDDNSYNYAVELSGICLKSDGYIVEYGIYAPRTSQMKYDDIYIYQCKIGFFTFDSWLTTFTKVICNSNSIEDEAAPFITGGSGYGWDSGSTGFKWADDGTGNGTGTTLNAEQCWARDCGTGWNLYGLQYSTITASGADNISRSSYFLNLSKVVLNGCGTENVYINSRAAIYALEGNYTFNNFQASSVNGNTSNANSSYILAESYSKVVFNTCKFENFLNAGASYNISIQIGATIINNASSFPTNGASYISYSSDSSMTTLGIESKTVNSTGTYYLSKSLLPTEKYEKINNAIASTGTAIATFSCIGDSMDMMAAEITVSWKDTIYSSGCGLDTIKIALYQDGSGANYRQNISFSSVIAGNGTMTSPVYTLSRTSNVWSLIMTPSIGDCTATYIKVNPYNMDGFTTLIV